MLGKLLKYEMKATARIFLPFYGALIVLGIINRIFYNGNMLEHAPMPLNITASVTMLVYILVICAIFALVLIVTIQRFYKNLLGEEGYLMFTLPVQPWKHIVCKLMVSIFWIVVSGAITILSLMLMFITLSILGEFPRAIQILIEEINISAGVHAFFYILEGILLVLSGIASEVLHIYAAISIGQLSGKHRILCSFGAYVAISFITQLVSSMSFWMLSISGFDIEMTAGNRFALVHLVMVGFLLWTMLFNAAYFVITNVILKRKLNLE